MRVEVTADDIREGVKATIGKCVIELAIARAAGVGVESVFWGYSQGHANGREYRVVPEHYAIVEAAIAENDRVSDPDSRKTKPFSFETTELT